MGKLIVIAGLIGIGKTTLADLIGDRWGWEVGHETVDRNPFLPLFYKEPDVYSYSLQVFFLGQRVEQHLWASQNKAAVLDRSLYEDWEIFVQLLKKEEKIGPREVEMYKKAYHWVVQKLPPPSLLVYLKAKNAEEALRRMALRGRDMEAGVPLSYLEGLNSEYKRWIPSFKACPVLTIPQSLDFSPEGNGKDQALAMIEEAL